MISFKSVIEKYRTLKSMNETISENSKEFENMVAEKLYDNGESLNESDLEKDIESGKISVEEESEFEISDELKVFMKKEYVSVSKVCHPDVEKSAILNRFFIRVSSAYESKNVFEIMDISNILFESESFDLSEKERAKMMIYLDIEISRVKSHRLWKWRAMSVDQKNKEVSELILTIKNHIVKKDSYL